MPLYVCSARAGAIDEDVKPLIAKDITRIHCDITDAPPTFVHVFFQDLSEDSADLCSIFASIRAGRTEDQRSRIHLQMRQSVAARAGLELDTISMASTDVPASWIMEGGDILPEPGEEAAWLAKHQATVASTA